uniref:NADH-ubiquinone oxidoreductase chain 6 n=1 Tax=Stenosialis australiensis TaxID=1821769 RepID=A0A1S5QYK7_9NEOP|nr:NADH dehydrogenase subunit 6 [Stenosialis australiensis]
MNQFLLILFTIMNSMNFIQLSHPLAMGLCLLFQTILISFITGMIIQTFWFSYILFLVMLGGMLVLFIYVTTLASNEIFSINSNNFIILFIFSMLLMLIFFDKTLWNINNVYIDMLNTNNNYFIMNMENSFELLKLYNKPTMNMTLILVNYLLLTLIIIVKITNIFSGPLRQKI